MEAFTFTPEATGTEIELTKPEELTLLRVDGFGALPPILETQPQYLRGGDFVTHARNPSRNMLVSIFSEAYTLMEAYLQLDALKASLRSLAFLDRSPAYGILRRTRADGKVFEIRCFLSGGLEDPNANIAGNSLLFRTLNLQFYAELPNFLGEEHEITVVPGSSGRGGQMPSKTPVLLGFGSRWAASGDSITYEGNADSWNFSVDIEGPALDPIIYIGGFPGSSGSRPHLGFRGVIPNGEILTVDMQAPDYAVAMLGSGANWSYRISSGGPFPLPAGATTDIVVADRTSGAVINPTVTFRWRDEYTGC